jgi:glycosyltransferase involved in cell wall biosynthesis
MQPLVGSGLIAWHRRTRAPQDSLPGLYHVMSPFEMAMEFDDVWPAWIRETGSRLVVTLYDLIPLVMREQYLEEWGYNGVAWLARLGLIRSADQVLTISQHTASDAMERVGIAEEKITVIDSGVSDTHSSLVATPEEAWALLGRTLPRIRPGFLLYVGGDDPRKNLEGTIRAYSKLPQSVRDAHQLVIAFRVGPLRRFELRTFAQPLGIRPRDLVLTGFVTDEQLAALYRACELFIFPSVYEGAGLPILEAMSCGAPVAASRTTSIPELLGDLEATFDPAEPADIAHCLEEVLRTPGKLDSLRARSERRVQIHSWKRVAERTLEGYERAERIAMKRPRRRRIVSGRRRLAVVTPWPPEETDAALYSRRLVEHLSERAEVEVIVSADQTGLNFDRSLGPAVSFHTDDEFAWLRGARGYDRCVFVLGSSGFHLHAFESMMSTPGVVLAHEVQLLPLYRQLHRRRFLYEPFWLECKLGEMYSDRIPERALGRIALEGSRADGLLAMTAEVQSHAERVLVHSRYQADLLRLDEPPTPAPTDVVPFALPPSDPRSNGARADAPQVVAIVSPDRQSELEAAFGLLTASHPGARLRLLSEQGAPDPAAFSAASLAVCLRSDADGGRPSAPVASAIAARVPTIVSDLGWQAELPDQVVLHVPVEFDAASLTERMRVAIEDQVERGTIREAQDSYAEEHSFTRVADRYAELLDL